MEKGRINYEAIKAKTTEMKEELKKEKEKEKQVKVLNEEMDILVKKTKGWIKDKLKLANFKEPVLWLIDGRDVRFFEGVKRGEWKIPDDHLGRIITLTTPLTFKYGDKEFHGYIHNLDDQCSYPTTPQISSEMVKYIIDKMQTNHEKLKTEFEVKANARNKLIWTIVGAIIVLALVYIYFIKPELAPQVVETGTTIARNLTTTTIG